MEVILIILAISGWMLGTAGCAIALYALLSCKARITSHHAETLSQFRSELQDAMNDVHTACQGELFDVLQSIREEGIIPASPKAAASDPFITANFSKIS